MQRLNLISKTLLRSSFSTTSTTSIKMSTFHSLKADLPSGEKYDFKQLEGKIVLIHNGASACGYTAQYTGLEALYKKYKDQGLVVLNFPCNQFGGQESKSDEQITSFCTKNYGVTYPIMKKSDVNGNNGNEVFKFLKGNGSNIGWNFEKFLVNQKGEVVKRYDSSRVPASIAVDIEALLK